MGYPLYAYHKTHKHGKTSNILSDIIVLNAYKLSLKFFINGPSGEAEGRGQPTPNPSQEGNRRGTGGEQEGIFLYQFPKVRLHIMLQE